MVGGCFGLERWPFGVLLCGGRGVEVGAVVVGGEGAGLAEDGGHGHGTTVIDGDGQ